MRDDAPPNCPRCELPLRKTDTRRRAGTKPDDVNHIAALVYRCDHCRMRWVDGMDGNQLVVQGTVTKKS